MKVEKYGTGVPFVAHQWQTQAASMRMQVWPLASLSELRIQHCCEMQCRLQTRLGSHVAVAQIQFLSQKLPYAMGAALKRWKKKKKEKKRKIWNNHYRGHKIEPNEKGKSSSWRAHANLGYPTSYKSCILFSHSLVLFITLFYIVKIWLY